MRKNTLAKIHIAKKQLGLDDETYRSLIAVATDGKTSCKDCNMGELNSVLVTLAKKGFKARLNPNKKRLSPKSTDLPVNEINKIRALWIQMFNDGFLRDGSEPALSSYVKRMTKVESVQWLKYSDAHKVLESIKKWHKREMCKAMNNSSLLNKTHLIVANEYQGFLGNTHNER